MRALAIVVALTGITAAEVRIETRDLPWWTVAGDDTKFVLGFPARTGAATPGRAVGPVRSADITLAEDELAAVECAWRIVPMGDRRPCGGSRQDAMAAVQPIIHRAFDDLRERAAAAGATVAADVRCFGARAPDRVWCEGTALVPAPGAPAMDDRDPTTPVTDPPLAATRLAIAADGSFTMFGRTPVRGADLALRYRPFELAFDVLVLSPSSTQLAAVGGTALFRFGSRPELLAGATAAAVAPNGAVNPTFHALSQAFVGLGYQTRWRISGAAQPFVQLRVGAAHGVVLASPTQLAIGLHIGLATPDRHE